MGREGEAVTGTWTIGGPIVPALIRLPRAVWVRGEGWAPVPAPCRCRSTAVRVVNEGCDSGRYTVACFDCDRYGKWRSSPEKARRAWAKGKRK
jgi:hypothetical protein